MSSQAKLRLAVRAETEPSPRCRAALEILLHSWDYARAAGNDVWDFAEELASLRAAGISHGDLRWLLREGIICHAEEVTSARTARRAFQRIASLALPERTCFVLTAHGEVLARRELLKAPVLHIEGIVPPQPILPLPHWLSDRRELLLGDALVKRFRRPAPHQETILAAFQEEGWPARIDDPLTGQPARDAYECLHTTINHLNRCQANRLLRFAGDGTGQGVRWEAIGTGSAPDRHHNGT